MRVALREDAGDAGAFSTTVAVDGDGPGRCSPCTAGTGAGGALPVLAVQVRLHEFTDSDGNRQWSWRELGSGAGIVRETRREVDDTTGHTSITGQVMMAWDRGLDPPTETAVLVDADGLMWGISAVAVLPGALRLTVGRVVDVE